LGPANFEQHLGFRFCRLRVSKCRRRADTHAYCDGNTESDTNTHAYCDGNSECDTNTHAYCHCNTDCNGNSHIISDCNGNDNTNRDSQFDANSDAELYSQADSICETTAYA
jgi:hypothetical protein